MQANDMQKYCDTLLSILSDDATVLKVFQKATTVIDAVLGARPLNRDLAKTQPFTAEVLGHLRTHHAKPTAPPAVTPAPAKAAAPPPLSKKA